jgi:glycosyltransferase involved in cell wall biosynthesis
LASAIAWLIEHRDAWPTMGDVGRRFMEENYDLDVLNSRLEQIYCEMSKN